MSKEKDTSQESLLDNFSFDDMEEDFFGIKAENEENTPPANEEETSESENEEEVAEEKKPKTKVKSEETTEEEEEMSFFDQETETEEQNEESEINDNDDTNNDDESTGDDFYSTLSKEMKERGLTTVDFKPEEVIDEDSFFELQDKEIESRVDEVIESWAEEMDEDGAAFIRFKKDGGRTSDFFKVYSQNSNVPQGDIEDEAYQERLNRYYYREVENLDEEDINDRIEWLKESGKLEKYAKSNSGKLDKIDKKRKEDLAKLEKQRAADEQLKQQEFSDSIKSTLNETEEIGMFKFNAKDKKELHGFITKKNVKIGKNAYVTPFQSALQSVFSDKEKLLVLAKLLKDDFDISEVTKKQVTKQTKKVKSNLRRTKTGSKINSSGRANAKRDLADHF